MNIGQDSNTFGPYLINISCGITIEKYQVFLKETSESLQFSCSVLVVTFRKPSVLQSFELKFLGLSVTLVFQSFSLYFHKKNLWFSSGFFPVYLWKPFVFKWHPQTTSFHRFPCMEAEKNSVQGVIHPGEPHDY